KSPGARPATALELARELQVVEQELRLAMTDIEVPDASWLSHSPRASGDSDEGRTVVRAVTEVDPTGERPAPPPAEDEAHTVLRPAQVASPGQAPDETESTRSRSDLAAAEEEEPPPRRRASWKLAASAGGLVAVAATGILLAGQLRGEEDPEPSPSGTIGTVVIPDVVPSPEGLGGQRTGPQSVEFTWSPPQDVGDVTYSW